MPSFTVIPEVGGNFVDTANAYSGGRSEELLGTFMRETGVRDHLVWRRSSRSRPTRATRTCAATAARKILEAASAAAEDIGRTAAQVALNWVATRPGVISR